MASGNLQSEQWLGGAPRAVAAGRTWEIRARAGALKIACLCLIAYCATGAVMLSFGSARLIHSRLENSYPEGPSLYGAIRAAQSGHLYSPIAEAPYTPQPYGPLYYAVNVAIAKASHLDVDLIAFRSRLLVFCCFLLSGALVALIARKLKFSTGSAVLAGLMLLGQPDFYPTNVSVRPDMLCLAGMLLSLLVVLEGQASEWAYAASGVLAGLAFLIKQSAVALPVAIVAVLLVHRKYRQFAWFTASAAAPVVIALGFLLWRREPFYEHFASTGHALWSVANGALWTKAWLVDIIIVIPLAIGAIGFAKAVGAGEGPQMIAVFTLTSWCVALATIPQLGGSVNYFQPVLAGCAMLLPFAIRAVRESARSTVVIAVIGLLLLWAASGEIDRETWPFHMRVDPRANHYAALAPFQILSDRTFFNLHGRNPQLLDPFLNHSMEVNGHWNPSAIVAALDRGDYDLIILACTGGEEVCNYRGLAYFGAPIVDAINRNYSVMCSTLGPRVLRPRFREVSATPAMLDPVFGQPCGTAMQGRPPGLVFAKGTR